MERRALGLKTHFGACAGVGALQADLVQLSTNGTQIIAEQSGHYVQNDQPDLVVQAIRQVVEAARQR